MSRFRFLIILFFVVFCFSFFSDNMIGSAESKSDDKNILIGLKEGIFQNGAIINIDLKNQAEYKGYRLSDPDRIAIELLDTKISDISRSFLTESDLLDGIRLIEFKKSSIVRVEIGLTRKVNYEIEKQDDAVGISVTIRADDKQMTQVVDKKITDFIDNWKSAWESKDIKRYRSFYHQDFGKLDDWIKHKQFVFKNSTLIYVDISDLKVSNFDSYIVVSFMQKYRSDVTDDVGLKVLTLKQNEDGNFKVVNETWSKIDL